MTPPDACTGSPTKAPIFSAPMRATVSRNSSTRKSAKASTLMPVGRRNGSGDDSLTTSSSAPSIQSRSRGRPLSEADR